MKLRIAIIAPPWIRVPPVGYGGIEAAVNSLLQGLIDLGHRVDLFSVAESAVDGADVHAFFEAGQYGRIFDPLYDSAPIPLAHLLAARRRIRELREVDIVHDHNYLFGPIVFSHGGADAPPVLHTLHAPFPRPAAADHASILELYSDVARDGRLWMNGISHAQLASAPAVLLPRLLGAVHNAVDLRRYPFAARRGDSFVTLARFSPEKGHATAARLCQEHGARLTLAGAIGTITSTDELAATLADPSSRQWRNRELTYFRDEVRPHLDGQRVRYVGEVRGAAKIELLGRSKALLFPIEWDEPFGVAVVEAMACGTPVIAFRRGATPELIKHGVNGFLADTEEELVSFMSRVDEIDPHACRAVAEEHFAGPVMARRYAAMYHRILEEMGGDDERA